MNTRARTTRDTQGQVGQRKKELVNKLPFANQANLLPKVRLFWSKMSTPCKVADMK